MLGSSQLKPWLDIVYRRRYWILVPALVGLVGGIVTLTQMPKVYRASTTVVVKAPTIPEGYVPNTVSTGVLDRLGVLSISMLSRETLLPVARDLELIGPDAKEAEIAAALARLQKAVKPEIDPLGRPPKYFMIHVEDKDPRLTFRVANALAQDVVSGNAETRVVEAKRALKTAQTYRDEVKKQLEEQEARVGQYRRNNLSQLPEQLGSNMALLSSLERRIADTSAEIRRLLDQIGTLRMMPQIPAAVAGAPVFMDPAVDRYKQLQRELADLELKYQDTYPDVVRKRDEMEAWARAYPHVLAPPAAPKGPDAPAGASPTDIQIATVQMSIKRLEADKLALEAQADQIRARIGTSPMLQTELDKLTRDLETLNIEYQNWLKKETDAERALSLELQKLGEQFEIKDRATRPRVPYRPVPSQVILTGLAIGLGLGLALSFLLEFLDNSVKTEEEFQSAFPELPLLAAIPDLDRPAKRRKKASRRRAAAAVLLLALPLLF